MLCMRGLGNVASLPDEHIRKHSTAVLSAVMTGMDDRNDPNDDITLEAMRTLNKIFEKVEEDTIRNILINISLRIRPCFEKDKPAVRAAAIELFGNLSQFGDGPSKVPFLEQVCVSVSVSVSVCLCVSVCVCVCVCVLPRAQTSMRGRGAFGDFFHPWFVPLVSCSVCECVCVCVWLTNSLLWWFLSFFGLLHVLQIHSNLISFILHLEESDREVADAVACALLKLAPLLESEDLTACVKGNPVCVSV